MINVGLTGGIGSGKSTVLSLFSTMGGIVVNYDAIAYRLVKPGTNGFKNLIKAFGQSILLPNGKINRSLLSLIVFNNSKKLAILDEIFHPLIKNERKKILAKVYKDSILIEEIPMLTKFQVISNFKLVIVVNTSLNVRIKRLIKYRKLTEKDIRVRISKQATKNQLSAIANVQIDNSSSITSLFKRSIIIWNTKILPLNSGFLNSCNKT